IADGLHGEERARFDEHVAACEACAAELRAAEARDRELAERFASAKPQAGLEDRLIQGLRQERTRRLIIPPVIARTITGVAATVLLAGFGYVVSHALDRGGSLNRVASYASAEPDMYTARGPTTAPAALATRSPQEV